MTSILYQAHEIPETGAESFAPLDSRGSILTRRRRQTGNQSGYILGVVLVAMTVGLLLITALLSLSFTTHRAAISQQEIAREQRAADGGLETALTRIRTAANTGSTDLCEPLADPDPEVDKIDFNSGTDDITDDVTVDVDCEEVLGNSLGSSAGSVEVVGDDYSEVLPDGLDWTGWPWSDALGTPGPDASTKPTVVHNADQPLLINGSMSVRKGAAPLLNLPGETGAIDVSGSYVQGDPGYPGSGQDCGMLDLGSGLGGDLSRTAVVDDTISPSCGDSATASLGPTLVTDGPTGVPGQVPACSSPTVTFDPGDYGSAQIDAMNNLFDGSCSGTLFHFNPGDYWFGARNNGDAITFADAGSAFVFGTVEGSGPTAECNPASAAGVRLVLSSRTTIDHEAGNVSICAPGGTGDAIVESSTAPSGIKRSNATTKRHDVMWYCEQWWNCYWLQDDDFSSVGNVLADAQGSDDATGTVVCANSTIACVLRFGVDLQAEGDRPIHDLKVAWTSSESPPAHGSRRGAKVTITGGPSACSIYEPNVGRTPGFVTTVDLSSCFPGQPESALNGAHMEVAFDYQPPYAPIGTAETIRLKVRGLNMMVNAHEVNAGVATSPSGSQWTDPNKAIAAGGGAAVHPEGDCYELVGTWVCERTMADTSPDELVLKSFDLGSSGLDADDQIESLALVIDNAGGDNAVAGPIESGIVLGTTRVSVDRPDGAGGTETCEVPATNPNTYTRSANTYMIDILAGDAACSPLRHSSASVLNDITVRLSMSPEKGMWLGDILRDDIGLQLPQLDYVRLVATTNSSSTLHRGRVTSDGAGTRFRVHGNMVTPRISLDVRWEGPVDMDPIVSGSMQVHSIGSSADVDGTVGVLCCGPGQREVRIVSKIKDDGGNWIPRGVARAAVFQNAGAPLADATVTGWQLCAGSGCVVPTGGVLGPPP